MNIWNRSPIVCQYFQTEVHDNRASFGHKEAIIPATTLLPYYLTSLHKKKALAKLSTFLLVNVATFLHVEVAKTCFVGHLSIGAYTIYETSKTESKTLSGIVPRFFCHYLEHTKHRF